MIYIIEYHSLLPIGLNLLDSHKSAYFKVFDNGLKVLNNSFEIFDGLNLLDSFKALTIFFQIG